MTSFDLVGAKVRITTLIDNEITGYIYSFCRHTDTLALQVDGNNYRVIKTAFIKDLKIEKGHAPAGALPEPGYIDPEAFGKRIQKSRDAVARIGVGVSKEYQELFDLVSKTVPCVWDGKEIVAMDEVRISEKGECVGKEEKTVKYIKQVVDGVMSKIESKKGG